MKLNIFQHKLINSFTISKTILKSILLCALLSTFMLATFAQAPSKFNYQGAARDASGTPLTNQNISLRISIIDSLSTGNIVYAETHGTTTNAYGMFSLAIGDGMPLLGTMDTVAWSTNNKFLKIEMDETGGTNYTDLGTTQLLSVPFAMYAASGAAGATGPQGATGPAGSANIIGTTDYLVKFSNTTTGGNSILFDNGSAIGLGTATPSARLHVHNAQSPSVQLTNSTTGQGAGKGGTIMMDQNNFSLRNNDTTGRIEVGFPSMNILSADSSIINLGQNNNTGGAINIASNPTRSIQNFVHNATVTARPIVLIDEPDPNFTTNDIHIGLMSNMYNSSKENIAIYGRVAGPSPTSAGVDHAWCGFFRVDANVDSTAVGVLGASFSNGLTNTGILGAAAGANFNNAGEFYGDVYVSGILTQASDRKLKKNIADIQTTSLSKLMQLKPKSYEFRTGEYSYMNLAEGTHYGFIAQELQTVIPALVKKKMVKTIIPENKNVEGLAPVYNEINSVNYTELIPILTAAIQEQQMQIELLKKEIVHLKNR